MANRDLKNKILRVPLYSLKNKAFQQSHYCNNYLLYNSVFFLYDNNKKDYSDTYKYFAENYERYLKLRESFFSACESSVKEKPSNSSYEDAKRLRNQKQRDEKRFKALEKLIPETEEKIKVLEDKISTEYSTDYVNLSKAMAEKEELEAFLLEIMEEYYQLSETVNQ